MLTPAKRLHRSLEAPSSATLQRSAAVAHRLRKLDATCTSSCGVCDAVEDTASSWHLSRWPACADGRRWPAMARPRARAVQSRHVGLRSTGSAARSNRVRPSLRNERPPAARAASERAAPFRYVHADRLPHAPAGTADPHPPIRAGRLGLGAGRPAFTAARQHLDAHRRLHGQPAASSAACSAGISCRSLAAAEESATSSTQPARPAAPAARSAAVPRAAGRPRFQPRARVAQPAHQAGQRFAAVQRGSQRQRVFGCRRWAWRCGEGLAAAHGGGC